MDATSFFGNQHLFSPGAGTAEIHQNSALPTACSGGRTDVGDHLFPDFGIIMRAVDSHAVGSSCEEFACPWSFRGSFRRQSHHDPHATWPGDRTENRRRLAAEIFRSRFEASARGRLGIDSASPAMAARVANTASSVGKTCASQRPSEETPSGTSACCRGRRSCRRRAR